jgi:hypothetical protein
MIIKAGVFSNAFFLHYNKAGTVRDTQRFISVFFKQLQCFLFYILINRYYCEHWFFYLFKETEGQVMAHYGTIEICDGFKR